jgi:hypothetical protein
MPAQQKRILQISRHKTRDYHAVFPADSLELISGHSDLLGDGAQMLILLTPSHLVKGSLPVGL